MTRATSTWLARALALAVFALVAGAQNRAWIGEVECRGPLVDTVLDLGPAGRTRLVGSLVAGETRRLAVVLPARSEVERVAPRVELAPDLDPIDRGSVRFVRWRERGAAWSSVPAAIRARTRPPVEEGVARARPAALGAALAAAVLVLATRRRAPLALAIGTIGAVAAALLGAREPSRAALSVEVLDGASDAPYGRLVEGAIGAIALPDAAEPFELFVEPPDSTIVVEHPLDGGAAHARAPGRRLWLERPAPVALQALAERRNELDDLSEAWWREAGAWSYRGAWRAGEAIPPPREGPAPPGWLASALPQGPDVLVGRRASSSRARERFIRVVVP